MEDKFGALLKEEAEEDLANTMSEAIKKNCIDSITSAANAASMTWGGRHQQDDTHYKIR